MSTKLSAMLARGRSKETLVDAGIFALILGVCGAFFYLRWPAWEDQSAQIYMTWGLFHGMRPFVDLIDPNWPGILLPHIAAYLISGTDGWGLRLVDLCFTLVLLVGTSYLLSVWGASRMIRLLVGTAYLVNYFGTTWAWTAQRESFCWPLFVISAIPLLAQLGPSSVRNAGFGKLGWFLFGIAAGFSLWIKPVAWPAIGTAIVAAILLCDRDNRPQVRRGILFYVAGISVISLAFLSALLVTGTLSGFIKWGIYYDLGPYSQVKWPWPARLRMTYRAATNLSTEPLPLLLVAGGLLASLLLRNARARWSIYRRPVAVAAAITVASLMAALLQGKTHSAYHFIPFKWGIAYLAGVLLTIIPRTRLYEQFSTVLFSSTILLILATNSANPGMSLGAIEGRRLRPLLAPDDQIVLWGYSPSFLVNAERKTPFATFISTSMLITSPPDSWAFKEVLDRLDTALRDPRVRYLVVDQYPCFVIQYAPPHPKDYFALDPAIQNTLRAEYRLAPDGFLSGYDVLVHIKHEPPATQPTP